MRVLFLCTGNSARSQMAEALLREADAAFEAHSAGTTAAGLNPLTVAAMAEVGIDVSHAESKTLERYLDEPWDRVITVCDRAKESCPLFPGAVKQLHWSFPDPAEAEGAEAERLAVFRDVRDQICARIDEFVSETLDGA
jgi:arsenate reductase